MFDNSSHVYIDSIECLLVAVYCNVVGRNSSMLNIIKGRRNNCPYLILIANSDKVNCKHWLKEQDFDFPPTEEQMVEFKLKYL